MRRPAGIRARVLPVDYASHSGQVAELRQEILAALAGITPGPARVPMLSAMTGEYLDGTELDARYWYDSLRAPVEFDRAARILAGDGYRTYVEVSPHPVLATAITGTLEDAGAEAPAVTGTLRRGDGGPDRFLASLAEVHVRGGAVDWAAVLGGGRRVDLPTYAFARQRYWPQARPRGRETSGRQGWARWGIRCSARRLSLPGPEAWCSPACCRWRRSRGWPATRWRARCCCLARPWWRSRCRPGTWPGAAGWPS